MDLRLGISPKSYGGFLSTFGGQKISGLFYCQPSMEDMVCTIIKQFRDMAQKCSVIELVILPEDAKTGDEIAPTLSRY